MGWFSKKEEKKEEVPKLPELPKLPEFQRLNSPEDFQQLKLIHQLPSFPSSSLGDKFSQDTIKEAVTGRKRIEAYEPDEAEDDDEEFQMMGEPQNLKRKEIAGARIPREFRTTSKHVHSAEPIFIRLDKFEEALKTFEKTREQITEIENMLKEIKRVKEKEEEELEMWEGGIQSLKEQIERVDKEVFSKVE